MIKHMIGRVFKVGTRVKIVLAYTVTARDGRQRVVIKTIER